MPAMMFRAPVSVVRKSGNMGFVQDNGVMRSTGPVVPGGNYVLTDSEVGAKPLVLIGDCNDILCFLVEKSSMGIENKIADSQIYMGVKPYRPGPRFVGIFPFSDAIETIVTTVASFACGAISTGALTGLSGVAEPTRVIGSTLGDLGNAGKDFMDNLNPKGYAKFHSPKESDFKLFGIIPTRKKQKASNLYSVTWSYLPDKDLTQISELETWPITITFGQMYGLVETEFRKLHLGV